MDWNALFNGLLGPNGVAFGAVLVVAVLWREHVRSTAARIADLTGERDRALTLAENAVANQLKLAEAIKADSAARARKP